MPAGKAEPPPPARTAAPVLAEEPTPNNPFVAKAALRPAEGRGGGIVELVLEARTAPGWHVYAAGASQGGAVPTTLGVQLPRGVEPAGEWQYPQARAGPEGQGGIYEGGLQVLPCACPRVIEFRDALPKRPSGKIKRKELREGERRG